MLADVPSVAFKVTNFNAKNMQTLQANWPTTEAALRLAVNLLSDFGFAAQTLAADSVLIPIAYYLHRRGLGDKYRTAQVHSSDRAALRGWLLRTLLKSGVWGSGLDTMLIAIRSAIQKHGDASFPVAKIESAMAKRGKFLRFTEDEIQDLLDTSYGEKRTLVVLSVLYPHCNLRNEFEVDHVFPRSQLTPARLRKASVAEDRIEQYHDMANRLANLHLLEGAANKEKRSKLPAAWLVERFPVKKERTNYRALHDLGELPDELSDFGDFYVARRSRLAVALRKLLMVTDDAVERGED